MLLLSSSFEFEIDIERWVFALFVLLCSVLLLWVFNGIKRTVWFAAYGNVVRKVFDGKFLTVGDLTLCCQSTQ